MLYLVIFLLVVITVAAYLIFDLQKKNKTLRGYSQELQNTIVLQEQKETGLNEQINMLKAQVEDMQYQRESVQRMVELGFLKVSEENVVSKKKIAETMSEPFTDGNVIYLGRHV